MKVLFILLFSAATRLDSGHIASPLAQEAQGPDGFEPVGLQLERSLGNTSDRSRWTFSPILLINRARHIRGGYI